MTSLKTYLNLFFLVSSVGFGSSAQVIIPCKLNDDACVLKSAKHAMPLLIAGIPELGIEPSDPIHHDVIDGNLSVLKYKFTDSTSTGLKNCKLEDIKLNVDKSSLYIKMICTDIVQRGNYEINGRLIVLPIEGQGTYELKAKKYIIGADGELNKVEGKDGKMHLHIKNFKLTLEAQDGIRFDFKNLFNGQKDLCCASTDQLILGSPMVYSTNCLYPADAIHTFANENWKEVANFVQEPVFNSIVKKIVSNINKFLKSVPYEDLFVQ